MGKPKPDNVVPYADQALLLALRGAGQEAVMQLIWIYEHPLDLDGVRRFHQNFGHGLVGRLVETSPLPFGRHRWVSVAGPQVPLEIAERSRPREELWDWAHEQVELPLDPEYSPAWRIGVQSFDDGTSAVSLVVSHTVVDGGGVVASVIAAVHGAGKDLGYPLRNSRTRSRAVLQDLRQLGSDLPEIGRTLVKAVKVATRRKDELVRPSEPVSAPTHGGGQSVMIAFTTAVIDKELWDQRAKDLGGNHFSLVAGFAGKLAQNLGRTRSSDGAATLMIPVSERDSPGDTGGNVVTIANVTFDPGPVAKDLSGARSAIKKGLITAREKPDEMVELLPLIPFLPKRAMGRMADMAFNFSADVPVSCSNMGDVPDDLLQLDGTPSERFYFGGVDRNLTLDVLERRRGLMTVASARVGGMVIVPVMSYQPGADNSRHRLREVIAQTLAEFDLSGIVE
ncbi:hypothetical protein [Mycolicibacterium aichiense]|uniref:Fatty acyl-AMP ligase FadD28 and polyketide synthase n=1 Tax=Mycolicibacterium aichiense TaxID=1799 RepID=A0AAD1MCW2_9MYCO|nr:hypothetical protein [Mycolicibacterium aichiense]MCV7020058.1 hypothetical protein [Mycolicibacterium aichiense]BBX07654.1 hypothetical protein MAIC_24570 [Mycolicibacterium aichiense]STZ81467.1 Fatty acyl-AMP ligase FadD28 and polyketide synthase [Mycolicibacterium aichiense]